MFTDYAECQIEIHSRSGDGFPFSIHTPGGDAAGVLHLPTSDATYQQLAGRLAALQTDEQMLSQIGQMLFNALFQGQVREVFSRSQGTLAEHQGLRIKLSIAATEHEVAALPWEYIYDPNQGPLVLLDAPIVRYIPQPTRIPALTISLPLRVLLTAAQTVPPIDVQRELHEIQSSLAELGMHVQIVVEPNLTTRKLQQRLREGFHVWHFIGHGSLADDDTRSYLCFEDATRGVERVSALQLAILLNRSGVRLVVLDACDSTKLVLDPFRALAPALLRAQVAAVVAMQFSVPEETTRIFAREFYRTVAEGFPIDACVTEGRKAIMSAMGLGRADWGIPIIYTRAPDGRLFEAPAAVVPVPPLPGDTHAVKNGLVALHALMQFPEAYAAVVSCRDHLQAASKRIGVLSDYKELHDQFQRLDDCYACIYGIGRRGLLDQNTWEYLGNNIRELDQIVDALLDCATRVSNIEREALWAGKLDRARQQFSAALKQRDVSRLAQAIQLVGEVLGREPSRINTRLVAAASELDLPRLLTSLRTVLGRLSAIQTADTQAKHQIEMFGQGVEQLALLARQMDELISSHDIFQEIDDELRWVQAMLEQDTSELQIAWQSLKPKMQQLCDGNLSVWAARLIDIGAELDRVLTTAAIDMLAIRETFLDYRSQVSRGFNKVDWDLRTLCGALRDGGAMLSPVLGMIG